MLNLAILRQCAEQATKGPWKWVLETEGEARKKRQADCPDAYVGHEYEGCVLFGKDGAVLNCSGDCSDEAWGPTKPDAQFIATFNPATILALLAVVEAAQYVALNPVLRDDNHKALCAALDAFALTSPTEEK